MPMRSTPVTVPLALMLFAACVAGCRGRSAPATRRAELNVAAPANDPNWKKLSGLRAPIMDVQVLNGCELTIAGVRCKLFGVRLPEDRALQSQAKRFLELYMRDYGAYFSIYNDDAPVNDRDGVPLIWLDGHGNGGWAQEALVQAGLVVVDYTEFENYKFRVPAMSGSPEFDWKRCLRDAEADRVAGKKPNVNFTWPGVAAAGPAA